MMLITAMGSPILGTKVNCKNPEHTSPFRVVADIITMRVLDYVVWANRSGSKTYSVGGFPTWYMSAVYPRLQTKILGGAEAQSQLSYEAMRDFFRITETEKQLLTSKGLMASKAEYANGSEVGILSLIHI